jgi:hypothetical protein
MLITLPQTTEKLSYFVLLEVNLFSPIGSRINPFQVRESRTSFANTGTSISDNIFYVLVFTP